MCVGFLVVFEHPAGLRRGVSSSPFVIPPMCEIVYATRIECWCFFFVAAKRVALYIVEL